MDLSLSIFLATVVLYMVFAARLGRYSITMPMVFIAVGILLSLSPFGMPQFQLQAHDVEFLSEITLALLLFADASTLNFRKVRDDRKLIARLLLIGLPLTIVFGGLVAFGFLPQPDVGFALLLGAILAPTDLALGLPIFTNPRVPARVRRALNVESGLNDGIATPFVMLFLALAISEEAPAQDHWLIGALASIGIAVVVAGVVGFLGGKLYAAAVRRGWTAKVSMEIGVFALAVGAYFTAVTFGGNGFIAAFAAGILFGYATRGQEIEASDFTETSGTLLALFVWAVFGANLVIPLFTAFNPLALLYAILSLTVIRMLPVAISLRGMKFRGDTILMFGWLGPRGLASVVFILIAYESFREANITADTLFAMAGWTIFLSVILHGLTAVPLANWYARRLESADPQAPELQEVTEPLLVTRAFHAETHAALSKRAGSE